MAGIFGLLLLPRERPRRFFPVAVDLMATEEEEGSMALGKLSFPLWCWSSTGGKWSAEQVEETPFKEGG
jgi:hypothetical protein